MNDKQTPQEVLQETVAAIAGHYTDPSGKHPSTLDEVMALPQFREKHAQALKQANGNGQSAIRAALGAMLQVRDTVHELPVHVIEPNDYEMDWPRGGRPTLRTDKATNEPIRGVRVVLPDGAVRFLSEVPAEARAKLERGQPAKMVGDITVSEDLGKKVKGLRSKTIRLGKADLKVEAHGEPFPQSGNLSLDRYIGKETRFDSEGKLLPISEWGGAYRLDGRTKTISLRFGPNESDSKPYDVQCRVLGTVKEVRYDDFNEGAEAVKLTVEDSSGNRFNVKEKPANVAAAWGIQADGEYSALVGQQVLCSGYGSIDAMMDVEDFGPAWAKDISFYQEKGLLVPQKGNASLLQLAFSDANIKGFDAMGAKDNVPVVPHVIIGDKRIVSMYQKKDGSWEIKGLAADFGRNPWMSCQPTEGGRNRTGFICWLSRIGGKLTYSNDDPLYAALANIELKA